MRISYLTPLSTSRAQATDIHNVDGHVRIWSTEAIANSGNPEYTKPRQLAAMSHHSGTIHSVRFSSNGKYLASGADDKIVCVYNLDPTPPAHTTFGRSKVDEELGNHRAGGVLMGNCRFQ